MRRLRKRRKYFVFGVKLLINAKQNETFVLPSSKNASDVELTLQVEALHVGKAANERVGHFVSSSVDDG